MNRGFWDAKPMDAQSTSFSRHSQVNYMQKMPLSMPTIEINRSPMPINQDGTEYFAIHSLIDKPNSHVREQSHISFGAPTYPPNNPGLYHNMKFNSKSPKHLSPARSHAEGIKETNNCLTLHKVQTQGSARDSDRKNSYNHYSATQDDALESNILSMFSTYLPRQEVFHKEEDIPNSPGRRLNRVGTAEYSNSSQMAQNFTGPPKNQAPSKFSLLGKSYSMHPDDNVDLYNSPSVIKFDVNSILQPAPLKKSRYAKAHLPFNFEDDDAEEA